MVDDKELNLLPNVFCLFNVWAIKHYNLIQKIQL